MFIEEEVHEAVFDLQVEIAKIRRTIEKTKEGITGNNKVGIYRLDTHQGCSRSLWMSVVWIQHIAMEANIVMIQKTVISKMMKINKPVRLKSKFALLFFILSHQVPSIFSEKSFFLFILFIWIINCCF
ncbi:hypothetical protein Hanom_Chr05g00392951 [Helianthus anomalus]